MSERIPWTAEQLTESIAKALKDQALDAIPHLLRLLAVVDPRQAETVYETLQLGIALAPALRDAQGGRS